LDHSSLPPTSLFGNPLLSRRPLYLILLGLLGISAAVAEFQSVLRPDVAFLLYAAERVLGGARLYVDVVEINPPLIIGLNVPAVVLGRTFNVPAALVYRSCVLLLVASSLGISAALLKRLLADSPALRRGALLLAALVLLPMAEVDFGEREHLMLALFLPYAWLVALRARGQTVPAILAGLLGLLVGIGVALKPHFLLAWLGLEIYRRGTVARRLAAPTPESTAVMAVLLAYAVFVLLATPEYLILAAELGPAYSRFLHQPMAELLVTAPGASITLLALLTYLALRQRAAHRELWDVLMVGSLAFFLAGTLQQKGLRYHFYPSFALATMFLGFAVRDARAPLTRTSERLYRVVASAAVLTIAVVALGIALSHAGKRGWGGRPDVPLGRMVEVVRRHAAGSSIFVFSYHIGSTFPLVNYAGVEAASRFPQLWILTAEYVDRMRADEPLRYRTTAEMSPAERYLNEAVLADLERSRPHLLLVLRNARDDPANGLRRLDYLAYFGRDPRFADLFARYQFLDRVGEYVVYRRLGEEEARDAAMPAATPGTLDVQVDSLSETRRLGRETVAGAAVFLVTLALLGWREARLQRAGTS
jgi:hypothetical protein